MDFLKSAVASAISGGPLGAYSVGDRIDVDNSIWSLSTATKRDTNTKCCIFSFDISANRSRLPIAKNAVRKARTLHHPGVVKVLDTIETDSQLNIITEAITPLSWETRRQTIREETAKWGLWSVAKTIEFINKDAASVHGCVRASSIFTSEAGDWKLGGFELLSSMNDPEAVLYSQSSLVPDLGRYLAPEIVKSGWNVIKASPLSAVDAYGFGILVSEVFNGSFSGSDQALQAKGLPPSMQQTFKRLLNPNPKARISVSNFLDQGRRHGGFFQTPLVNLTIGLDGLGLKSDDERGEFLGELSEVGDDFPQDFMKRKILPELLKSVEYGGGGPTVFNMVLKIGSSLTDDEYESQLTPVLVRLFSSPDRAIRVCLLDSLPLMIDHLAAKVVNDKVFPNLVTGFTDTAPLVREQTVKSVLTIITKLSDRTINGELLKYLAKTANDPEPGIRTNTTICLGKIAKHLGRNSRSKVLIAAFTRALRDPFVHSRNAGLLALAATADMFTDEDCATKVLPALVPSLIDKERIVRDQANKAMDTYLTRVRKYAATLPDTALPPPDSTQNSRATTPQPRMYNPSTATASAAGGAASWAGWAISSFTATSNPAESKSAAGTLQPAAAPVTLTNGRTRPPAPHTVPRQSSQITSPTVLSGTTTPDPATTAEAIAEDFDADAWGDLGDMDEADAAAAPSSTIDTDEPRSSFTSSASSNMRAAAPALHDSGEPDFAAWLAAKNAPKAGKALPKGLGAKKSAVAASAGAAARPSPPRAATTGTGGVGAKNARAATPTVAKPAKEVDEAVEEDGWGDAWD